MKFFYFWLANGVLGIHLLFGLYILFGWQWSEYHILYWTLIAGWIASWLILGYCVLSKIEFTLRSQYDKTIDPNHEIIQYYTEKILGIFIPSRVTVTFGAVTCVILLTLSIVPYFA